MIDPTSVAFDVDGVIADTMALFIDIARREYRVDGVRYEDMTSYLLSDCLDMDPALIDVILNRIMAGEYASPLQAISGSGAVLSRIAGYRSPLLFVTARPHPGPISKWMCDLVRLAPETVQVVATGTFNGKAKVLLESGIRFFVEDRLETCYQLKEEGIEPGRLGRLHILEVQRLIRFMPKVVIAVVPGWAVGGGHSLHVVCDLTIASREHAVFKQTDADVASFDGGYGSALLARQVGQKKAREIFFLGADYSADQAVAMGAANAAVPHADLEKVALEWAAEINRNLVEAGFDIHHLAIAPWTLEELFLQLVGAKPSIRADIA